MRQAFYSNPFPEDVRVAVLNKNTDWGFECMFDGNVYKFPPGQGMELDAETAHWIFSFETRVNGGTPYRDLDGGGSKEEKSYFKQRCQSLGLYNDDAPTDNKGRPKSPKPGEKFLTADEKIERFLNFSFKVKRSKKVISGKEFEAL